MTFAHPNTVDQHGTANRNVLLDGRSDFLVVSKQLATYQFAQLPFFPSDVWQFFGNYPPPLLKFTWLCLKMLFKPLNPMVLLIMIPFLKWLAIIGKICLPLNPMVLLIIIPIKWLLNG